MRNGVYAREVRVALLRNENTPMARAIEFAADDAGGAGAGDIAKLAAAGEC